MFAEHVKQKYIYIYVISLCPDQLCKAIVYGLRDQMCSDGRMSSEGPGCLCPIDEAFNYEGEFWDDLSGKHFRKEGVIVAHKLEVSWLMSTRCTSKSR